MLVSLSMSGKFFLTRKIYLILVTTALNKAEQVLGRKFIINEEHQAVARERKQGELNPVNKST
jgi:hypothetical protein